MYPEYQHLQHICEDIGHTLLTTIHLCFGFVLQYIQLYFALCLHLPLRNCYAENSQNIIFWRLTGFIAGI